MESLYIQLSGQKDPTPVATMLGAVDPLEALVRAGLSRAEALQLFEAETRRAQGVPDWAALLGPGLRIKLSLNTRIGEFSTWSYLDGRPPDTAPIHWIHRRSGEGGGSGEARRGS